MKIIKKLKLHISFSLFLLSICISSTIHCNNDNEINDNDVATEQEAPNFAFSYENEDIINIINQLATLKNLNVIFPPGDILNTKVTLHMEKKITITQAWDILNTLLDVAGFFIVPQDSLIRIVRSGKEISREP